MSPSPITTGTPTAQPNLQPAPLDPDRDRIPTEVGLTPYEARQARSLVGCEPNTVEWGMFGAMWSEHCGYKHSKKLLRTLPTKGARVALGPGENAGAVDLGGGLLCVFKVESHNHPSAVEPYQGAATGVGGILRDIFAMGARPVALLNALAFGPPDMPRTRRLVSGVVGGISFYGNCIGIPDIGGHVSFEPTYANNPLVNAMCIGIVARDRLRLAATARPGSAVYLVGSDTGRDGIAGASLLASFELGADDQSKRPSVQVGDPFLEKLLMEATIELVERDAVEAIQDLGAAGLTCAASEVAAKSGVGMRVDVDRVPRRATGMTPYEVMLSESQERMLVIARPGRERDVEEIFRRWELHGTRIGEVTADRLLQVFAEGKVVASLEPSWLVDEVPEYDVRSWAQEPSKGGFAPLNNPPSTASLGSSPAARLWKGTESPAKNKIGIELLALLASPRIASRRILYRTYDQMVGTDTVVGPGGDAAVLRIKGRPDGIATSVDAQPRIAASDPFTGAAAAVAEATRNVVCMGARPLAITDCLNLGNPERPQGAWQLVRTVDGISAACDALGVPVVSGNVSLYNATRGSDIWPTAVIGAVGHLDDVSRHIAVTTGLEGDIVLLAGSANVSLFGSAYLAELESGMSESWSNAAGGRPGAPIRGALAGFAQARADAAISEREPASTASRAEAATSGRTGEDVSPVAPGHIATGLPAQQRDRRAADRDDHRTAGERGHGTAGERDRRPIDIELEARLQRLVLDAHARGLIRAAHDRSDGGLAVTLAELCLRDGIGMKVTLPAVRGIDKRVALFGEAPSGVVLVIAPENADGVRDLAQERDVPVWTIGTVGGDLLEVAPVLGMPVASLRGAYEGGLAQALGRAS